MPAGRATSFRTAASQASRGKDGQAGSGPPPGEALLQTSAMLAAMAAERARAAARRLRNSYRMEGHRSKRMSQLLVKADAGVLTSAEGDELDRLVTEFEKKTLAMAQALVASFESPEQLDPANRQSSR